MFTVRELPLDEWDRLRIHPDPALRLDVLPDPGLAALVVVEDAQGQIVARWGAQTAVHLEGLSKTDAVKDNLTVSRLLLEGMKGLLAQRGVTFSFTITQDLTVAAMAVRAGFTRVEGDLLLLDLARLGG